PAPPLFHVQRFAHLKRIAIVSHNPRQDLEQIVPELESSPLFQLSLASKELFHSNFLAWLGIQYPRETGRVFAEFLRVAPADFTGLQVYRERENIDLTLRYPDGQILIVENKVKSLPDKQQLTKYASAVKDKGSTSYLLLSLTTPTFLDNGSRTISLDDGTVWRFISYAELAERLANLWESSSSGTDYHRWLLADYCMFIRNLDRLQVLFSIDWSDDSTSFFDTNHPLPRLRVLRLHDLVDKIRYSQLGQATAARLSSLGFDVLHPVQWPTREGQVAISSGLTHGTGLFDLKYLLIDKARFGSPVILGIQLQGNAFRLVLECWNAGRARAIAEQLLRPYHGQKLWFDFTLLATASAEYPKRGDFNQFGGTFLYRSRRLSAISPAALINRIASYAEFVRDNEAAIREHIEGVLASS
ncbi:MAG: hypothetical protein AVDCRST_MAG93-222, partial [uncultured Chloroflexia bacterium]